MDVAVRDLKAKLSAYLKEAAAGATITVTDRGRPIAMLGPVLHQTDLAAAIADGWVTPATSSGLAPVRRRKGRRGVLDALAEDRAE